MPVEDLRQFIQPNLPDYMHPSLYVFLEKMPLTPSGKVARRMLPEPEYDRDQASSEYIAPRNHTEETVVELWQQILNVEPIGIQDNFFELGGHSLLAIQIVARIRDNYEIEISPRQLFDSPTVKDLALFILEQEALEYEDLADLLDDLEDLSEDELAALLDS